MKLTPAEKHLLVTIKEVKLPKSLGEGIVSDLVDEKILKKIVRELMKDTAE